MKTVRHAPRRGQSILELALALLVFVTIIMLGIHFAEVGYLPIKVHEAAVSPLWDSTALRVHRMRGTQTNIGDFSTFPAIAPSVEANANSRYHDFDGRSSTPGAGDTSVTQVFTRIQDMLVRCERQDEVEFDLPRGRHPALNEAVDGDFGEVPAGAPTGNDTDSVLTDVYQNMGGISCRAEARLDTLPSLPRRFLEQQNGFFDTPHAKRIDMKVCGFGRAVQGECKGRYGILLGDWSFGDREVSEHCPIQPDNPDNPCPQNRAFYYAAMSVFDRNLGSAGDASSKFAEYYAGYSPIDEDGFFMSYRGEEDGYVERQTPDGEAVDMRDRPYNTGGIEHKPSAIRRKSNTCFLGLQEC
ncbi:MAG: pilus assembly protein [Cystobacter sp.]